MDKAKLTWLVKVDEDAGYSPAVERFIGTHTPRSAIKANIQLWNNRRGVAAVEDLKSFAIRLSFQDAEDSILLNHLVVMNEDGVNIPLQILGDSAIMNTPANLVVSGTANNGVPSECKSNYYEFTLLFNPKSNIRLKENDLKNLFLEVIQK